MTNKTLILGCGPLMIGEHRGENETRLDIIKWPEVDIVRDIEKGLPFANKTFDKIIARHVLEHIKDLVFVMMEIHRVLKIGGIIDIEVPYGKNARIDPTHKRFFCEQGLDFFIIRDYNSISTGVTHWFKLNKGDNYGNLALHWELERVMED